ncbi:Two-component sensor histidine kinase, contains HisKA and HATPase domains [Alkalispirochaeta americana]|uniref:histidine kinase n=1 Tax=Alkalispirochaeta americana TaxID=159291 RepID=A0A1N6SMH9_9SPIO|nr:histidine kinase dimerization/phosphoacceptor domain -containing protein [Alkalispirochaeta americana]SIQ42244.1 Two-component sensor histidine kinase, contains HisKA and HATPase domains [Alkalispirochaeta americana]
MSTVPAPRVSRPGFFLNGPGLEPVQTRRYQENPRRRNSLALGLSFLVLGLGQTPLAADVPRDILVLQSYHPLMRWGEEILQGVADEFSREAAAETLYVEYLDTKRWDPEELFPAQADFLRAKYAGRLPELIIATDDNALNFLVSYREEAFPEVPVLYTGINRSKEEVQTLSQGWATGIIEEVDFLGTIDLALKMLPDLSRLAVVTDATVTADLNRRLLRGLLPERPLGIDFLPDLPTAELQLRLRQLPPDSAVLYVSYIRLSSGELYSYTGGLERVAAVSPVPVFVLWDFLLGNGHALGGRVLRGRDQGRAVAGIARRYFQTGQFPRADSGLYPTSRVMLDYRAVDEWGLISAVKDAQLDVEWLNRRQTAWDLYRLEILVLVILFSSLFLLLLMAAWGRRQQKKQHNLLMESEQRWQFALEGGRSGVWDWDMVQDSLLVSDRWYSMLGYSVSAWISAVDDSLQLIHPDDLPRAVSSLDEMRASRSSHYELSTRKRCADGTYRWMLDQGMVVERNAAGTPVRAIGTQTDIDGLICLQQQLKESLGTKDVLIREIHHRVKNNMQIVASMLSLEMSQGDHKDFTVLAEKTRLRIHAMAALHEQLYANDTVALVPLQGYLCDLIGQLHQLCNARILLRTADNIPDVNLDIDEALPLGLLINELVSNACEHAFEPPCPASVDPQVTIGVALERQTMTVQVVDNGCGMTQADYYHHIRERSSLGLVLIDSLVQQLEGLLTIESPPSGGTVVLVRFPQKQGREPEPAGEALSL